MLRCLRPIPNPTLNRILFVLLSNLRNVAALDLSVLQLGRNFSNFVMAATTPRADHVLVCVHVDAYTATKLCRLHRSQLSIRFSADGLQAATLPPEYGFFIVELQVRCLTAAEHSLEHACNIEIPGWHLLRSACMDALAHFCRRRWQQWWLHSVHSCHCFLRRWIL